MTPRIDMDCVPVDSSLEEARQLLIESGHSRLPVIGDSPMTCSEFLYSKDLLNAVGAASDRRTLRRAAGHHPRAGVRSGDNSDTSFVRADEAGKRFILPWLHDEYGGRRQGWSRWKTSSKEIVRRKLEDEYDEETRAGKRFVLPHRVSLKLTLAHASTNSIGSVTTACPRVTISTLSEGLSSLSFGRMPTARRVRWNGNDFASP